MKALIFKLAQLIQEVVLTKSLPSFELDFEWNGIGQSRVGLD